MLDTGYMKSLKEVPKWAKQLYDTAQFTKVQGAITFCSKPLKPVTVADPKKDAKADKKEGKKESKKEEAPKP